MKSNLKELISELAYELTEVRSDISDILNGFVEDDHFFLTNWKGCIESRHAIANIPSEIMKKSTGRIQYDTLTTLFSVEVENDEWEIISDIEYK